MYTIDFFLLCLNVSTVIFPKRLIVIDSHIADKRTQIQVTAFDFIADVLFIMRDIDVSGIQSRPRVAERCRNEGNGHMTWAYGPRSPYR